MPSTYTDRLQGLTTSIAVKGPCRVATTANITLSGLQTIDGVAVLAGDRVLVKDQTAASENGIYTVASNEWVRALDFDGSRDVVGGTFVRVISGSVNARTVWVVDGSAPLTPASDAITFSNSPDAETLETLLATSAGAAGVGFIQSGAGASTRTAQAKMRDAVSPEDFGAVGDGTTDDSAAFLAALAAHSVIECNGNKHYVLKDITLSNSETIDGNGARFTAASGATFMFKLTNYAATVTNFYIADGSACSEAVFVFDNGRFCRVADGTIVNCTSAFALKATVAATGCVKPQIDNVNVETFTAFGIALQPNVLQLEATDVFIDQGGASSVGISHVSTGSIIAYGGHTYNNVRVEGCGTGWIFTDATLTEINGGWADTCDSIGVRILGATDHININNFFIGTSGSKGLSIAGTSVVYVNGLETFVSTDTVEVFDTAILTMDVAQWRGAKVLAVAAGAKFIPAGALLMPATSIGTIPVSTTTYLGLNAVQASESDTGWILPYDGYVLGIYSVCTVTPVTSHVYTARLAAADTSLVATIAPASFGAQAWGAVSGTKGQKINTKVATSTTNASGHSTILVYAPL